MAFYMWNQNMMCVKCHTNKSHIITNRVLRSLSSMPYNTAHSSSHPRLFWQESERSRQEWKRRDSSQSPRAVGMAHTGSTHIDATIPAELTAHTQTHSNIINNILDWWYSNAAAFSMSENVYKYYYCEHSFCALAPVAATVCVSVFVCFPA